MLAKLKQFVKKYQADIFITVSVVLVALLSFGIGRLSVRQNAQGPIIIQNPEYTASVQETVSKNEPYQEETEEARQGQLVGSVNSNKYHWPDCPWAKKIAPQNQVWFASEEEARSRGYVPCQSFDKYKK